MKEIAKKLRSRLGETIAETLVSLLIASLALMTLAGMITATTRNVRTSEKKINSYYEANVKLQNIKAETAQTGSVTIKLAGQEISYDVLYEENDTFKDTVTAYRLA